MTYYNGVPFCGSFMLHPISVDCGLDSNFRQLPCKIRHVIRHYDL